MVSILISGPVTIHVTLEKQQHQFTSSEQNSDLQKLTTGIFLLNTVTTIIDRSILNSHLVLFYMNAV